MLTRRSAFKAAAGVAAAAAVGVTASALRRRQGAQYRHRPVVHRRRCRDGGAHRQRRDPCVRGGQQARTSVKGYTFELVKFDDGTATAGQYDPAQAATNARKMVVRQGDRRGARPADVGRRQGDVADPVGRRPGHHHAASSTNPDITDPKFAAQYRPAGKAIYFRTVATDAFQGPNMANYMAKDPEGEDRSSCSTTPAPTAWAWPMRSRRRPRRSASRCSAATGSTRRRPTIRPS